VLKYSFEVIARGKEKTKKKKPVSWWGDELDRFQAEIKSKGKERELLILQKKSTSRCKYLCGKAGCVTWER